MEDETANSQLSIHRRWYCRTVCRFKSCSRLMKILKRGCGCPCKPSSNGETIKLMHVTTIIQFIALQFAHCQNSLVPAKLTSQATTLTASLDSARSLYMEVVGEMGTDSPHSRLAKRNAVSANQFCACHLLLSLPITRYCCEKHGFVLDSENPVCLLPKVTGPCRAAFRRYYYNNSKKRCELFIYGGCQGNKNNFKTLGACKRTCGKL